MGFLFRPKELPRPASLTFTLDQAGHTYDDGHVGLAPTDITISELRVAVIGLNGAGKSTLLGLLDGSLKANAGTVTIAGGEERLDPAVKKDAKRIDNLVGKSPRGDSEQLLPSGEYFRGCFRSAEKAQGARVRTSCAHRQSVRAF